MKISINEGYCYQTIGHLIDVTTSSTAQLIMNLAAEKGVEVITQDEAFNRGFIELSSWSISTKDILVCIDGLILICINSKDIIN